MYIARKLEKQSDAVGTILSALPIPGVGAGYMSYQDAKDAPKGERVKNFLSGFIPGTLGGAGAMVGSGMLANRLRSRLAATGKIHPTLLAAMPYLVGAGAGMLAEPIATNLGLKAYHRKNAAKTSSAVTNEADLNRFITEARRERSLQPVANLLGGGIPGQALSALYLNPKLNLKLEEAGLGAAGQSAGQNFVGSLGTAAGLGGGALGGGALGGLLAGGLGAALTKGRDADLILGLAGVGSGLGGLAGGIGGYAASDRNRANRLEKRIRDAYAAKTSSAITNEDDLNQFIMQARKERRKQSLPTLFGPLGMFHIKNTLNPELNRKLEGAGLGAAGQTNLQVGLGTLGSEVSALGGLAAGGALGITAGELGRRLLKGGPKSPLLTLGAGIGLTAGGIGGLAASENNRANRLEKRIREAYAANQLAG